MRNVRRPILTAACGLSLMELLVVLSIIALVSLVALPPTIATMESNSLAHQAAGKPTYPTAQIATLILMTLGLCFLAGRFLDRGSRRLAEVCLGVACLLCLGSMAITTANHYGWFEPKEQLGRTVRLTDLSTVHANCGPTCPAKKGVGR